MHVVACQLDIVWEDKAANHLRVQQMLDAHSMPEGSLIVLPEMFATGFSMNVATTAEDRAGITHRFLSQLATQRGCYILAGVTTRGSAGKARNDAVLFDPQGHELTRYTKMHPFTFAREHERFEPGAQVATFNLHGLSISPFVCYDLRFPEVFRHATKRGTHAIVVIANWPAARQMHWITLLRARAIENQAYVVGVNRCGSDPNVSYTGQSIIIDPRGETLVAADASPCVISATLDTAVVEDYRRQFPALHDMRGDLL